MAKQDDYVRVTLRLPRDVHDRVNQSMRQLSMSQNAWLVQLIEEGLWVVDEETGKNRADKVHERFMAWAEKAIPKA